MLSSPLKNTIYLFIYLFLVFSGRAPTTSTGGAKLEEIYCLTGRPLVVLIAMVLSILVAAPSCSKALSKVQLFSQ